MPALITFHYVDFNGVLLLSQEICAYIKESKLTIG